MLHADDSSNIHVENFDSLDYSANNSLVTLHYTAFFDDDDLSDPVNVFTASDECILRCTARAIYGR